MVGRDSLSNALGGTNFGWEQLLSKGMTVFLKQQDPEEVNFVEHPNGWSIQVKTDPESIKEAKEFWEENIAEEL